MQPASLYAYNTEQWNCAGFFRLKITQSLWEQRIDFGRNRLPDTT